MQGVDKFALYHDAIPSEPKTVASALELEWLAALYRDAKSRESDSQWNKISDNEEDVIEIQSAAMLIPDLWPSLKGQEHNSLISHRLLQPAVVSDCLERYKHKAEYIMHIDVDEFIYSPKFESVWEYLQHQKNKHQWKSFLLGRTVGLYVPSANFGSSGQFWDFHNFWSPDFTSGTVNAFFDPRDSSLFRFLQQLSQSSNRTGVENDHLRISDVAKQLDAFRTSRLNDVSFFPTDVPKFAEFVHSRLKYDFPANASRAVLLDSIKLPALQRGEPSSSSPLRDLEFLIASAVHQLGALHSQRRLSADQNPDQIKGRTSDLIAPQNASMPEFLESQIHRSRTDEVVNSEAEIMDSGRAEFSAGREPELNKRRFRQPSISPDLLDRVKSYHSLRRSLMLFYPLITEEQIRRGPSATSHLDSQQIGKPLVQKLFPVCRVLGDKREAFLIEKEGFEPKSNELKKTLWLLGYICGVRLPGAMTMAGKVVYFTSSMKRSQTSRSSGRLRGCHRPSVHGCSHWIFGGHIRWTDPTSELRIDHHQFRSYERRTFGLPNWRGGPLGYPKEINFPILQSFLGSVIDTGKLKFVQRLRERIYNLGVLPKMADYDWRVEKRDGEIYDVSVEIANVSRSCSAIELLGEHQVMCPSLFPYVGFYMTRLMPPHPYQPYSWCSDIRVDSQFEAWTSAVDFDPNESHLSDIERLKRHTVLCPGFGETRCCDFDSELIKWQATRFANETKVWSSPSISELESLLYGM